MAGAPKALRQNLPHSSFAANLVARLGASMTMGAEMPRYRRAKLFTFGSALRRARGLVGDGQDLPFCAHDVLHCAEHALAFARGQLTSAKSLVGDVEDGLDALTLSS